jgi:hypothetical protein
MPNSSAVGSLPLAHCGHYNDRDTLVIEEVMNRYRPNRVAPAVWLSVRPAVLRVVSAVEPPTEKYAVDVMGVVTRYMLWATSTLGVPLDSDELFHPTNIVRFSRSYDVPRTRQIVESRLLRIAEVVEGHRDDPQRPVLPRDARPYAVSDLPLLESFVASQRRSANNVGWALLGFCGGAGLRVKELWSLHTNDVERTDDGLRVHVGGEHPRIIPVKHEWLTFAERALGADATDTWVLNPGFSGPDRRKATHTFSTAQQGRGAPSARRLRVTWITSLIDMLPLADLLYAGGFSSPAGLVPYYRHAQGLPAERRNQLLAGRA